MSYVLVDVGCIECGENTEVIGVFGCFESALAELRRKLLEVNEVDSGNGLELDYGVTCVYGQGYFVGGQHHLEIHKLIEKTQ